MNPTLQGYAAAVMEAAGPGVFVSENLAEAAKPATDAVTTYAPALAFAVNTPDVAPPEDQAGETFGGSSN